METDTSLSAQESIKLARETQRLSNLKAIPGKWFYFFVSVITGLSFGLLSNQSLLAFIPISFFPVIIYVQKNRTGLSPLGFAPILRQGNGFYSFRDYWKDMLKVNTYIHMTNLIAILIMLSFPFLFIKILEFRDVGFWWAPIASGITMGVSHLIILLNYRNFHIIQFGNKNNE
jgi:hypothetical protein